MIAWDESYLLEHGIYAKRIDEVDDKASLIAQIDTDASDGLVFLGNTNVVPVAS